ncbi:sensor histidine kinase [Pasteurellaceae bacterium TAE3-ERU1]|nr:sensor histidine kinase [Pasteurellaceae bacterium TAE3-ERU1]
MAIDSALFVLLKTLCENAIHYTPTGGQVDVRVREMPAGMAIEVEDNGIGIAPNERARVCEPFYRVLGTGVAGTGLGLAIANTIVAQHRGTLVLADAPHFAHGLNVCVYLPFAR